MMNHALVVLLLVFWVGGCDYRSAKEEFDRQLEVCTVGERNGLLDAAAQACGGALVIAEEHAYTPDLISDLLYRLARLERQQGKFQEAEALVQESLAFEEESGGPTAVASRLVELSLSLAGQGRWPDGAQLLERAAPLVDHLTGKDREAAANAFKAFSLRLGKMGQTEQAEQFKDKAEELAGV